MFLHFKPIFSLCATSATAADKRKLYFVITEQFIDISSKLCLYFLINIAYVQGSAEVQVQTPSLSRDSPPPLQPVHADSIHQALLVFFVYDVVFDENVIKKYLQDL